MSIKTSLAGDPLKAGDPIGVTHVLPGNPIFDEPGWYWRDKARGLPRSLEPFEWHGPYATEDEAREKAITPMTLNRSALPKPPAYVGKLKGTFSRKEILSALVAADSPAAIPALFAQLRAMGVNCENCKWRDDPKAGNPEILCETSWVSLVEEYDFLCNSWEGK